jgi:acetyl-CoA C-acetyltransferase
MGEHAAITARRWGIGRAEQDELAAASHRHLAAAYERGFLDDLVTPYRGLARDQNLRPDSTPEKLARLKPVFGTSEEGATMTAGNSTPLTDGAALVLLASDAWAQEHGLEPLAYLTAYETAAVPFVAGEAGGDEGLLMAPVHAAPRMLKRAGLSLAEDFDLYEIHEAFASQVLATLAAWEAPATALDAANLDAANLGAIDRGRLNVAGSSLATGHPFAATGARITATLAKLLAERGGPSRGFISICAAGGQGVTAVLERP